MDKYMVESVGYLILKKVKSDGGELALPLEKCFEIGQDFLRWVSKLNVPINNYLANSLAMGKLDATLATWFLQTKVFDGVFAVMEGLRFGVSAGGSVLFDVYRHSDCCQITKGLEFDVTDTMGWLKDFIYLRQLLSDSKGTGEQTLQRFCDLFKQYTIKGCVGFVHVGDYRHYEEDLEWGDRFLERLKHLYLRNGFIDINSISGFEEEISVIRIGTGDGIDSFNRIESPAWREIDRLARATCISENAKTKALGAFKEG